MSDRWEGRPLEWADLLDGYHRALAADGQAGDSLREEARRQKAEHERRRAERRRMRQPGVRP